MPLVLHSRWQVLSSCQNTERTPSNPPLPQENTCCALFRACFMSSLSPLCFWRHEPAEKLSETFAEAEAWPSSNIRRADSWDWDTTHHKNGCRQDTQIRFCLKALDSVVIGMNLVALPTPPYSNSAKTDSSFQMCYLTVVPMLLSPFPVVCTKVLRFGTYPEMHSIWTVVNEVWAIIFSANYWHSNSYLKEQNIVFCEFSQIWTLRNHNP